MRIVARWGAALLVASSFAVVGGSGAAHAATFAPSWCGPDPVPCVTSLKVNGSPVTSGGGTHLDFVPWVDNGDYQDLQFQMAGVNAGDTIDVTVDLGSKHPDSIRGLQQMSDIDVSQTAAGHWILRMQGAAISYANGCDSSKAWPWPCTPVASDDRVLFEGDVLAYDAGVNQDQVGYYMGTNVTNDDISILTDSSGTPYLETEAVSPRYYSDGTTVVHGAMHFRLPYVMMRQDFGIPNPETMTPGSLTGTVNGASASFVIAQDPDGGGIYVDVSGFTFPVSSTSPRLAARSTTVKRTIKVRVGTIKPTKPVILKAKRVSGRRIWLTHTLSKPRGAKVTGYLARCVSGSSVATGTAAATATGIGVSGLRAAKAYDCRVAATSKVGRSAWSAWVHVRRA